MILLAAAYGQAVEAFDVDAEIFRPSTDATRTLSADDTRLPETWSAAAELVYQRNPFVFVSDSDGSRTRIVRDALAIDLMAAGTIGSLRVGASVPAYLWVTSDIADPRTVLGDPSLDVKLVLREGQPRDVGVALVGAIDIPLGGATNHLGSSSVAGRLGVAAEYSSSTFFAIGNAAFQLEQAQAVRDTQLGSHLALKGVVGWQPTERVAVEIEVLTRIGVLADAANDTPAELLLGVHHTRAAGAAPYVAVGTGLVAGIGAPVFRAITGVRYRR